MGSLLALGLTGAELKTVVGKGHSLRIIPVPSYLRCLKDTREGLKFLPVTVSQEMVIEVFNLLARHIGHQAVELCEVVLVS